MVFFIFLKFYFSFLQCSCVTVCLRVIVLDAGQPSTHFSDPDSMVLEMACDSDSEDPGVSEDQAGQLDTTLNEAQMTLKQEMDCAIKQSLATHQSATLLGADKSLEAAIKTEMALFESSGVRGRSLQLVYGYLLSIPPASVEAERAFSAAGSLCTKVRSRLGDRSLSSLCFLRQNLRYPITNSNTEHKF